MCTETTPTKRSLCVVIVGVIIIVLAILVSFLFLTNVLNTPPKEFPRAVDIVITEGLTVNQVTQVLEEKNVVRSSLYLRFVLFKNFRNQFVQAGTYRFQEPLTTNDVARSIIQGKNLSPRIKITLPEGFRSRELYSFLPKTFHSSTSLDILSFEGYLFPDTYFISNSMSIDEIISLLRTTHMRKMSLYAKRIEASGFTEREIIILASLLEREANTPESRRLISGIMHNRLRFNMPLQIDAVFDYILNKTSAELTEDDLKIDSPYNTYTHIGLPPSPISNPGSDAIDAALNPTITEYLYYLSDDDGNFYYAKTFEEHKKNKARYLRE